MRKKRENGESKENKILKVSILVSIIGSIIFLSVLKYTYPNLSYSEWYNILASFVAGALGGVITLITVYITLMGNKSQEYNKMKKEMQFEVCKIIIEKIDTSVEEIEGILEKNRIPKLESLFNEKLIAELRSDNFITDINIVLNKYKINRILLINIDEDFNDFKENMNRCIRYVKQIEPIYFKNSNKINRMENCDIIVMYDECLLNINESLLQFKNVIIKNYYNEILSEELEKYKKAHNREKMLEDMEAGVGMYEDIEEEFEMFQEKIKAIGINI